MSLSVPQQPSHAHLERLENVRGRAAKADLKDLEKQWKQAVGLALLRAFALAGLTQKEVAALTGRDQGQVGRWVAGTESASFAALFAVEALRQPIVIAVAELAGHGVEIETVVRVRRIA